MHDALLMQVSNTLENISPKLNRLELREHGFFFLHELEEILAALVILRDDIIVVLGFKHINEIYNVLGVLDFL